MKEGEFKKLGVTLGLAGLVFGVTFKGLQFVRSTKVKGYARSKFTPSEKGLIVLYGPHKSFVEGVIVPFLSFPNYLQSSEAIPISTPRKRYYDKKWYAWARDVSIPVPEGFPRATLESIVRTLALPKVVYISAETGRTIWGTEFKVIRDGKIKVISREEVDWDRDTKIIRRFHRVVGYLALTTGAPILLVWMEGGDKILPNKISITTLFKFRPYGLKICVGEKIENIVEQADIDIGLLQKIEPIEKIRQKAVIKRITEMLEDMMLRLGEEV